MGRTGDQDAAAESVARVALQSFHSRCFGCAMGQGRGSNLSRARGVCRCALSDLPIHIPNPPFQRIWLELFSNLFTNQALLETRMGASLNRTWSLHHRYSKLNPLISCSLPINVHHSPHSPCIGGRTIGPASAVESDWRATVPGTRLPCPQ